MSESVQQFEASTLGHSYGNYNGGYVGQCVSGIQQLLINVYGVQCGAWGNAVDYNPLGTGGHHLATAGFVWHPGDHTTVSNGDILVWGKGAITSAFGHTAYWFDGNIISQNYNGNPAFTKEPFFASGFLGYWHKPVAPAPAPAPVGGVATVTYVGGANVRALPTSQSALTGSVHLAQGAKFNYSAKVVGQTVLGNGIWYKSTLGHFVWSGDCQG